jgi:hypothetical protein
VPFWGKARRRVELRRMAMEIGTTLLAARMKAVRQNAQTSVVISSDADSPGIDTTVPAPPPTPAAEPLAHLSLSSRALRSRLGQRPATHRLSTSAMTGSPPGELQQIEQGAPPDEEEVEAREKDLGEAFGNEAPD